MSTQGRLDGRVALVCGASAGIGRAAAIALAERGAAIVPLSRRAAALEALAPELEMAGAPWVEPLAADLDDRAGLERAIRGLLERRPQVHVLVNNAGGPAGGPILEASEADFLAALGRHLLSAHLLVRLLVPGMIEAGYGRIVNVVSTSVYEPIPGLGVSNTTRAAVAGWAKTLAGELPPGITINNVLPGYTNTERITTLSQSTAQRTGKTPEQVQRAWLEHVPERRLISPEETAAAIAFLASPEAAPIRGVSLAVDGGRMRSI